MFATVSIGYGSILCCNQRRHNWTSLQASSDYKVTFREYLDVRPQYLEVERAFWREVDVLCSIPEGYDSGDSEEIWDDDSPRERLDGTRIANFDEVPFAIDWRNKQLMANGERVALTANALHRLKKYREGMTYQAIRTNST